MVGLEHNLGCQRATTQLAQLFGDTLPNVCFQIVVLIIYALFVKQCLVLSDKEDELAMLMLLETDVMSVLHNHRDGTTRLFTM